MKSSRYQRGSGVQCRGAITLVALVLCFTSATSVAGERFTGSPPSRCDSLLNTAIRVSGGLPSFAVNLRAWQRTPEDHVQTATLIERALDVSPSERVRLLNEVTGLDGLDSRAKNLLRLTLYDQRTWTRYVHQISKRGDYYGILTTSFRPVLERMPNELKRRLMMQVASVYPAASKRKLGRVHAPKRALDALMSGLIDPYTTVANARNRMRSPAQAYFEYLGRVRHYLGLVGMADYDQHDLFELAVSVQGWLIEQSHAHPELHWELVIFGSLPNGRGRLGTSDIDLLYDDRRVGSHLHRLDAEIERTFNAHHLGSKLETSGHWTGDFSRHEAAETSPVQIRIQPSGIWVEIYPRIPRVKGRLGFDIEPFRMRWSERS